MITVLLVDDYPVIRGLLRKILERHSDIRVIGEAETGEQAVAQVAILEPTVVLIDLRLPTMSGIEATAVIKRECPWTTVIGLTAGAPEDAQVEMRDVGAATVLSKSDLLDRLYPAIIEEGMLSKISAQRPRP